MSQLTLQTQAPSTPPAVHRSSCQDLLLMRILPVALTIIGLTSALMAYYHVYYSVSVCLTILSWTSVTALISRLAILTLNPAKNVPPLPNGILPPIDLTILSVEAPKFVDREMKCLKLPVIPIISKYTTEEVTYAERLLSVQLPKDCLGKFPPSIRSKLQTEAVDYELYAIALNDSKIRGTQRNLFLHPLFFENLHDIKDERWTFPEVLVENPFNVTPCAGNNSIPTDRWTATNVYVHPDDSGQVLSFSPDNLQFAIERLDQPSFFFFGAYDEASKKGYGCLIYLLHREECPLTKLLTDSSHCSDPQASCVFFREQYHSYSQVNNSLEEGIFDPKLLDFFELIDPIASVHS